MHSTRINHEGQVTIPAEIRHELNLQEGDVLMVEQLDGKVVLTNPQDIVRRTSGAFAKYAKIPPASIEEEKEAFARAIADEYVESLKDQG
ncbi:MAG: AbrB/MazE/SpoVT family DNA-binding domain-containing protein [Thermomicrobiales bacterium]